MPLKKSASEKGSEGSQQSKISQHGEDLPSHLWVPPKCEVQREVKEEHTPVLADTPMDGADTTASGQSVAQPSPYNYDRLPCLDDEPVGGLRLVLPITSYALSTFRLTKP